MNLHIYSRQPEPSPGVASYTVFCSVPFHPGAHLNRPWHHQPFSYPLPQLVPPYFCLFLLTLRPRLPLLTSPPADIVTTFTYQASVQGFAAAGVDAPRAAQLLNLAVDLAHQARQAFLEEQQQQQEGRETGEGHGRQDVGKCGSNLLAAGRHGMGGGSLATCVGTPPVACGEWSGLTGAAH